MAILERRPLVNEISGPITTVVEGAAGLSLMGVALAAVTASAQGQQIMIGSLLRRGALCVTLVIANTVLAETCIWAVMVYGEHLWIKLLTLVFIGALSGAMIFIAGYCVCRSIARVTVPM